MQRIRLREVLYQIGLLHKRKAGERYIGLPPKEIYTKPPIASYTVAEIRPILISADNLSRAFFFTSAKAYAILVGGHFESGLAKKVLA
jgi:hypothetical protein